MSRIIDADKLKKEMCYMCNDEYCDEPCEPSDCVFYIAITNAPTIEAEPVVHGHWIKSDFLHIGANQYRCSKCWEDEWWLYHFSLGDSKYCPNCGARLDEVSE